MFSYSNFEPTLLMPASATILASMVASAYRLTRARSVSAATWNTKEPTASEVGSTEFLAEKRVQIDINLNYLNRTNRKAPHTRIV